MVIFGIKCKDAAQRECTPHSPPSACLSMRLRLVSVVRDVFVFMAPVFCHHPPSPASASHYHSGHAPIVSLSPH